MYFRTAINYKESFLSSSKCSYQTMLILLICAEFQWLSLVCLAHGVSVSGFRMNNSLIIKHTFSASLSTHTAEESSWWGSSLNIFCGAANGSQRPDRGRPRISCKPCCLILLTVAGLNWWDLCRPSSFFPCIHTHQHTDAYRHRSTVPPLYMFSSWPYQGLLLPF